MSFLEMNGSFSKITNVQNIHLAKILPSVLCIKQIPSTFIFKSASRITAMAYIKRKHKGSSKDCGKDSKREQKRD